MIWSSLFSYAFLADGIYGEKRCRDENIILEKFLVEQTASLQSENEKYGELYKNDLQSTLESVNELLKNQQAKEAEKQKQVLLEYIRHTALPRMQTEYDIECVSDAASENKIDYIALKFDDDTAEQIFNDNGRRKLAELEGTKSQFDAWYQNYDQYCQTYVNELSSAFLLLSGKSTDNALISTVELNDDALISAIESYDWSNNPFSGFSIDDTINEIKNYSGYIYDKELAGYKGTLTTNLKKLRTKINNLEEIYTNINSQLEIYKNTGTDLENGRLILNKAASIMVGNNVSETDVKDFLEVLQNNIDLKNDDEAQSLDVETLNDLSSLIDYLGKYQKYLRLKADLDNFLNDDLTKTYIITTSMSTESQTLGDQDDGSSIIYLDEEQWRNIRKEDFAQFIRLLKMLPENTPQTTANTTITSNALNDNHGSADIIMSDVSFEKNEILNEAYILNRDLLENITVLEKAIN